MTYFSFISFLLKSNILVTYFSFISFLLESDILVTYFSFISFTSLVGYPIYILLFQFYEFPIVPPPPEPHLLPVKSIQYLIHTDYYLPKIAFWIFQCFHNVCAYPWLRFKLFIKFITLDFRFFSVKISFLTINESFSSP